MILNFLRKTDIQPNKDLTNIKFVNNNNSYILQNSSNVDCHDCNCDCDCDCDDDSNHFGNCNCYDGEWIDKSDIAYVNENDCGSDLYDGCGPD